MALSNLTLKSASVFLMLIYTLPLIGQQQYDVILKKKSILKNDEFGDCNSKIVISDNKLIILTQKKNPKQSYDKLYELTYPAYDLKTGQKKQIKVRINSPLFEYIDTYNYSAQVCDDLLLLKINEFAIHNLNYAKTKLLILRKSGESTFTEISHIENFQQYDGHSYQVGPSKLLFYKNSDYKPLDDSIPTLTSIYNIESSQFEKKQIEHFKEIYVTNLVGHLVAAKRNTIYKAYPAKHIITISDETLNTIDTLFVPIKKTYDSYYQKIDSLKNIASSKKEFIYLSKKIDKQIERIESIYLLSNNELGVIIKPENTEDFGTRNLFVYDLTNKRISKSTKLNYDYSGKRVNITEPNFTYTGNAVLFNETYNSIIYIATNNYVKNGKLKGNDNYYIHVMKYNPKTLTVAEQTIPNSNHLDSFHDSSLTLFNLKGDTIALSDLLINKNVIVVKNKKNCSPCFKKAHQIINKEYRKYNKYYICEYSGTHLNLLTEEKNIKKLIKVKNIYYFKPHEVDTKETPNFTNTPTPFIISVQNNDFKYLSLDSIINE
jgi:hypothetical protein